MAKKAKTKKPVKKLKAIALKPKLKVIVKAKPKASAKPKPVARPKAAAKPKAVAKLKAAVKAITPAKRKAKALPVAPVAPVKKTKADAKVIFATSPVIEREGGNIRVLIGKAGLDGHDRGAKIIARACRDAGFEVVYTGLHQTPEMIVNTAIQEDVDVLGLSILSGAHNYLVPEVIKGLAKQGVKVGSDILIVIGGIIPESDFVTLKQAGVSMVFTPGTSVDSIITYIRAHVKPKG